ncbi:MAG: type II toxin-antitoxin system prevent-host-death family antitoxin [Gemmatimonadaceae bacterium]
MKERTLSVTEAARSFADLVNRAYYRNESTLLVKNGVPVARLIPARATLDTAREAAKRWPAIPHLSIADATSFERDVKAGRRRLRAPKAQAWE